VRNEVGEREWVRAGFKESWGAWESDVGGVHGARGRESLAVAGKTYLTGLAHRTTRESERASERSTTLMRRACGAERERESRRARGKWRRQIGPTEQERGSESARTLAIADRWDPPVKRSGRARVS
jgi:hypothetical protein